MVTIGFDGSSDIAIDRVSLKIDMTKCEGEYTVIGGQEEHSHVVNVVFWCRIIIENKHTHIFVVIHLNEI